MESFLDRSIRLWGPRWYVAQRPVALRDKRGERRITRKQYETARKQWVREGGRDRVRNPKKNPIDAATFAHLAGGLLSTHQLIQSVTRKPTVKRRKRRTATAVRVATNPAAKVKAKTSTVKQAVKNPVYRYQVVGGTGSVVYTCRTLKEARDYAKLHPAYRVKKLAKPLKFNPAAKTNGRVRVKAKGGELYLMTIKRGDDVLGLFVHDGKADGINKEFKSLAAARAFASRKGHKLVENPGYRYSVTAKGGRVARSSRVTGSQSSRVKNPARSATPKLRNSVTVLENGIVSRWFARHKASKAYARELRHAAALERARLRREKAEHRLHATERLDRRKVRTASRKRAASSTGTKKRNASTTARKTRTTAADRAMASFAAAGYKVKGTNDKGQIVMSRNPKRVGPRAASPRVTNAARVTSVLTRKRNPGSHKINRSAARTFEMFNGRKVSKVVELPISRHAGPKPNVGELGKLIAIKLMDGRRIKVNPKTHRLVALRGRMWIAGGKVAPPDKNQGTRVLNPIDDIDHIVYQTYKPHHGDPPKTQYIHSLGEEGGYLPLFCVDNEGFAVLRGGSYKIRREGIRD